MRRYDDASIGVGTSEYDLAALLPIDEKSDAFQHLHKFLPGNVRRELH